MGLYRSEDQELALGFYHVGKWIGLAWYQHPLSLNDLSICRFVPVRVQVGPNLSNYIYNAIDFVLSYRQRQHINITGPMLDNDRLLKF